MRFDFVTIYCADAMNPLCSRPFAMAPAKTAVRSLCGLARKTNGAPGIRNGSTMKGNQASVSHVSPAKNPGRPCGKQISARPSAETRDSGEALASLQGLNNPRKRRAIIDLRHSSCRLARAARPAPTFHRRRSKTRRPPRPPCWRQVNYLSAALLVFGVRTLIEPGLFREIAHDPNRSLLQEGGTARPNRRFAK